MQGCSAVDAIGEFNASKAISERQYPSSSARPYQGLAGAVAGRWYQAVQSSWPLFGDPEKPGRGYTGSDPAADQFAGLQPAHIDLPLWRVRGGSISLFVSQEVEGIHAKHLRGGHSALPCSGLRIEATSVHHEEPDANVP